MPSEIVRNDIKKMQVDAAVIIGSTKEPEIIEHFGFSSRIVICAAFPEYSFEDEGEAISAACRSILNLAWNNGCSSIVFPQPDFRRCKDLALITIFSEFRRFLTEEKEMQIFLALPGNERIAVSPKISNAINRFIGSEKLGRIADELDNQYETAFAASQDCLSLPVETVKIEKKAPKELCSEAEVCFSAPPPPLEQEICYQLAAPYTSSMQWESDENEFLSHLDAGFSETLLKLIDKTGEKDSDVYKRANVTRGVFSKIRTNSDYQPSKTTALAFAFALHLDINATLSRSLIASHPSGYQKCNCKHTNKNQ